MKQVREAALTFLLVILLFFTGFAQPASVSKLSNGLVAFNFNPSTGTYSIADKRTNKACIENAAFQINKYSSTDGYWLPLQK